MALLLLMFGILVAVAVGAMAVCIAAKEQPELRRDPILVLSLGLGAGLALTSALDYLALLAGDGAARSLLMWEGMLILAVMALAVPRLRWADFMVRGDAASGAQNTGPRPLALRLVLLAAGAAVVVQTVSLLTRLWARPYGEFDAVSIWNVRARFFYLAPSHWRDAFAAAVHADYPLLLPLSVSRLWAYAGRTDTQGPRLLALAFDLGAVGLLYASLKHLRSPSAAALAVLALLAMPYFTVVAAIQYADAPLGYFILATCCCLALAHQAQSRPAPRARKSGAAAYPGGRPLMLLAGMMAGAAAWTKNEGLVFALASAAAVGVIGPWRAKSGQGGARYYLRFAWSRLGPYMLGLIPFLALVALTKYIAHAPNDLLAQQTPAGIAARIIDVERYRFIAKALWAGLLDSPTMLVLPLLALYLLVAGLNRDKRLGPPTARVAAALSVLTLSYLVVYLLTPFDLNWQISTTLTRLVIHVWAGWVFLIFLAARTPGEIASMPATSPQAPTDAPISKVTKTG